MAGLIRAAGGVVWRPGGPDRDEPLVCLVHRPRYDDWSLPKGKLHPGEHPLAAAVREVAEETGVRAVPRAALPPVRYLADGAPKQVDYWVMAAAAAAPTARQGSEVDEVAWLPTAAAVARVSHPLDAALLRRWAATPRITGLVALVRHADAGDRAGWPAGTDALRPLTARGIGDAARLGKLLALCAPTRLVSASPRRCRQTLAPLGSELALPLSVAAVFDETTGDPVAAGRQLVELATTEVTTVVCSQGAVIPPVLAWLTKTAAAQGQQLGPPAADGQTHETGRRSGFATAKGDGWLLPFSGPFPVGIAPLRLTDGAPPG
ncbi:NUDIX hydrolase [Natronosporangium hydrolyticum]|uniref:NUDIX hydrolase n=1 Tax=Natronosporangium hydrolyticum TaxID=2811111 RepID=A0A895Y798_9ACTN|nr:NUDIX hydrolase [Natronosporangium hydrolyticum]QSB13597.1 NUDIX hydrolase [Natronosporangium hydrolyticum]